MGSRKRSALRRQQERFRQELGELDLGGAFDAERDRAEELEAERAAGRRARGCERKQRYATRGEALDAIAACAEHGTTGLSCYRCRYCNGWHLTSHPWE